MGDGDRQLITVAEFVLEMVLPGAYACTIAAARIGENE